MSILQLPIPTGIPFSILRKPVGELVAAPLPDSVWWTRSASTRLINRCGERGMDEAWMLMLCPPDTFLKFGNVGVRTRWLAEEVLESIGGKLGYFRELTGALERARDVASFQPGGIGYVGFPQVVMALAGIGDRAKERVIDDALAQHGLRPGMPLDELFVYVSSRERA